MAADPVLYTQIALVSVTAALVVVTYLYVRQTSKLVKVQTAPHLYADMRIEKRMLHGFSPDTALVAYVKNAGGGMAYNVNFEVANGFNYLEGNTVKSFKKIDTIKQLAPQQEKPLVYVSMVDNPDRKGSTRELMNKVVKVKVTYTNAPQQPSKDNVYCFLDFPYYLKQLE